MTLPIDDAVYYRAANYPRPADWEEPTDLLSHTPELGADFAANGLTFFADFSEFQPYYNSTYPYPIASMRAYNGSRIDNKVVGNWAAMQPDLASGKLRIVKVYVVFQPGKLVPTLTGLLKVFGPVPDHRIVVMNDMESASSFAGPGNHSVEANQWMAAFAAWTGNNALRQSGYANASDWASNWPQHPATLKRITAAYNANDPSPYGWQYAGGNAAYPSPAGYPRSCPPFGAYIDMNVIARTIDQIEADFGIVNTPKPTEKRMVTWIVKDSSGSYWLIPDDQSHKVHIVDPADLTVYQTAKSFDGTNNYGTGLVLDDAQIAEIPQISSQVTSAPAVITITDAQATLIGEAIGKTISFPVYTSTPTPPA